MSIVADPRAGSELFLNGLRVVEVGRGLAAPLVGMVLAEQGADVVRIVRVADHSVEPVLDAMVARGKTELTLDLETPAGRATLTHLLEQADVVVENLAGGQLDRLGISFDAIRADSNPGLVSCSIPSFPAGDPRSRLPDYEAVASAAGFLYDKPIGKPRIHEFPVGSVMAALIAACGVVGGLIARLKIGRGQHVETSIFEASVFAQVLPILVKTGVPRGFLPFKMVGTPFMSPWRCKDGRYVYLHITLPAHNARILEILEQHGHGVAVAELRRILSAETLRDPSQVKSIPEANQIRKAYDRIFLTRAADDWEKLLGQELCCIKVRTVDEWVADSLDAGMTDVGIVNDPVFGELKTPGAVVASPQHPPSIRARAVGQEASAALLARWASAPKTRALSPKSDEPALRHPLGGIRVLDMSRVIAGPCAGRILAELGAEVVSLQSPSSLDWALSFHLVFNAGKKSVTLDFTTDVGKEKLWRLLAELKPQAFIQNYRHLDVAKAVGVDPEAVFAKLPDIVYTHLNAYGNEGGWRDRPGFEQVVQAVTGIQLAYGHGGRPKLLPTPIIDIGSGLSGALATLLGLYHRARTGHGSFAATHLTSTAVLFQVNAIAACQRDACLQRTQGTVRFDRDAEVVAGIYRALDGYACIVGPRRDLRRLAEATGRSRAGDDPLSSIGRSFWRRTKAHWQAALDDAGVAATVALVPITKVSRLFDDLGRMNATPMPLVRKRAYPGCPTELTFVRSPLSLSVTPLAPVVPPPMRGGDTREILARIGEELPEGAGVVPYPSNKPFLSWLLSFARWGYFAWRSGNI